jgi:C1A family cysteine protease
VQLDNVIQAALQSYKIRSRQPAEEDRVLNLADMKGCLAEGYPIVYGFTVYESFESQEVASAGNVPMPKHGEKVMGGHCVVAVGYDDDEGVFICRNSWGDHWGDVGYFYMPYAYLIDNNLSDDFWTIRLVG